MPVLMSGKLCCYGDEGCMQVVAKVLLYCRSLNENDVMEHSFELIFAFDEIVAHGYHGNVNLAKIHTFTEING